MKLRSKVSTSVFGELLILLSREGKVCLKMKQKKHDETWGRIRGLGMCIKQSFRTNVAPNYKIHK